MALRVSAIAVWQLSCTVMTWALWMGAPCLRRSIGPRLAAPRPIDGPLDIEETAKLASYARDGQLCHGCSYSEISTGRSDGVAVAEDDAEHAVAKATFAAVAAATPECEFLLAAIEQEASVFGRIFAEVPTENFDPITEVLFEGASVSVGSASELAAALAGLGFAPGERPTKSAVDELWERSAPSRSQPRQSRPPRPPRTTTQRFFPSPGAGDMPPFFAERREEPATPPPPPPTQRRRSKKQEAFSADGIKKAMDKFSGDLERTFERVTDAASREADKLGARVTGGESTRDKLDRLYQLTNLPDDSVPLDERLPKPKNKKKKKRDDDDWLSNIKYTPPPPTD